MKLWKKVLGGGVALATMMSLAACGNSDSTAAGTGKVDNSLIQIDVFDSFANFAGVQKGWFGKLIQDKFNMKLNFIAPNVAGGGNTLFNTRSTAGNLGDLILVSPQAGVGEKLVKSKLISDMTPYINNIKGTNWLKKFKPAADAFNKANSITQSGYWGLGQNLSLNLKPTQPLDAVQPSNGTYIRWDLYKALGYPKITGLNQGFVDILKQMQDLARKQTGDQKIYAISLWNDWDGSWTAWGNLLAAVYGYCGVGGFVEAPAKGSKYQYLFQDGGVYQKALQFLQEASAAGIINPNSSTQKWDDVEQQARNGENLFGVVQYDGKAQFNTKAHADAGQGFMPTPIEGQTILEPGATPDGAMNYGIYLGSKASDSTKQRIVNLINWLYSPDGFETLSNEQTGGVKGLTWEMKDGQPTPTKFGLGSVFGGDPKAVVPASWGGGTYVDGTPAFNMPFLNPTDIDPNTKLPYNPSTWPSYQKILNDTTLFHDWSAWVKKNYGFTPTTDLDYLEKAHMLTIATGTSWSAPEDSTEISTLKNTMTNAAGGAKAGAEAIIFAKNKADFDSQWKSINGVLDGLGMKNKGVLDNEMKLAKLQLQAREEAAKSVK